MDIKELLNQPESKTLEFKKDISSLQPILKTIVAFANTAGGTLVIGRSPDGTLIGVKDIFLAEEALANSISDNIRPSILPEIETITLEGKDLLVIKVSHWKGPFYIKKEGIPNGVYIRLGSTSRPASPELLMELQRSIITPSFDQQIIHELSKDSLELEKAKQAFDKVGKTLKEEKLHTLGILTRIANRLAPTIGGIILFGKSKIRAQYVPDAKVSCARFLGTDKSHILDQQNIEGSILDSIDIVLKFISRNTRQKIKIVGARRKDIPEYPHIALREALINALAHADYSITGSHIQVAIFDNRLEIQNPGMFPFGYTFEDLKSGVSRIRNRVIAKVFHELKFMEEWGSGYQRILEDCKSGHYPEPKWEEIGIFIRVTFYPPREKNKQSKEKKGPSLALSRREQEILHLFTDSNYLTFREIHEQLVNPVSERMLRYDLAKLKKRKLLFSKGSGRATVWQRSS